jgi:integrase
MDAEVRPRRNQAFERAGQNVSTRGIGDRDGVVEVSTADALDALFPYEATTLLVNSRGQPWTEDGFRASMWTLRKQLKAAGKIGDGLTVHGLRHTCGALMKELGFDLDAIADMLGLEGAGMAAWYARDAELEKKLAGVALTPSTRVSNRVLFTP